MKYNSFHDQLVLSGGTDGMVNLWRISSISSAPMMLDVVVVVGGGGGGVGGDNVNCDGGGSSSLSRLLCSIISNRSIIIFVTPIRTIITTM